MTTLTFTALTIQARRPWAPGCRRPWPCTSWGRPLSRAAWRPEGPSRGGSVTPLTLRSAQCASLKRSKGSPPSRWGLSSCQGATTTIAVSRRLCVWLMWVESLSPSAQRFRLYVGLGSVQNSLILLPNHFNTDLSTKCLIYSVFLSFFFFFLPLCCDVSQTP